MSPGKQAPTASLPARSTALAVLVVVGTAVAVVLGHESFAASWSTTSTRAAEAPGRQPPGRLTGDRHGSVGEEDGVVPDRVTVFDDRFPAVTRLDPDLLTALHRAAQGAGGDGIELYVTSGWRSPAYQDRLLREAVSHYGSAAEAARWVATPKTSAHVSGDAVDIGPAAARAWLSEHGATYALCQIYRDEPWHYELRPAAVDHGCPPMYADPTHDPRMRP